MSSVANPTNPTDVKTDKPVIETPIDDSVSTNQSSEVQLTENDTNSTQNEKDVSPLKRDSSEIAEKTPARAKKTRVDRFKEESKLW